MAVQYREVPVNESVDLRGKPKPCLKELTHEKIASEYGISLAEVRYLHSSFAKIASRKYMTVDDWSTAMGVKGVPRASHLAVQIFNSMDEDSDGVVGRSDPGAI